MNSDKIRFQQVGKKKIKVPGLDRRRRNEEKSYQCSAVIGSSSWVWSRRAEVSLDMRSGENALVNDNSDVISAC